MTELRKVTGPPSRADRNVWRMVAVVLAAILIAVLKPWGDGRPSPPTGGLRTAAPSPSASGPAIAMHGDPLSDFLTFGTREPPPGWELWPAGNLASFYFAMRIDMAPMPVAEPSGTASPPTSPTATPSGATPPIPADWPTIRIPAGSTLDLLGINHPVDYRITLVAFDQVDGSPTQPIHALLATSPWPDHFTIVGLASGTSDAMGPWPSGHYRLELRIDPGGVRRSVDVVVEPPATPSPSPSSAPG